MRVREFSREELYDLRRDPLETRDILSQTEGARESFRGLLFQYLEAAEAFRKGQQGDAVRLAPETLERLESLGYVDGTVSSPPP